MSWTIKGESGSALDATVRALDAVNFQAGKLTLASLESDKFEWTAATLNATGAGTIVPDLAQLIEVYESGVRRFRGHVTAPRIGIDSVQVVCEGPWWWMDRIALTSTQTDETGASGERVSYVFPTQDLKTSIEALIDRAITNGVPIIRGTVDAMFVFPRITLSEMSCAQALAELMSIVPDAVAHFDYSGAGNPILNITRRGAMAASTLTIGTDTVEDIDLLPRLDLEVKKVTIQSVTRNATTGLNTWATQTSGTSTPGKNQILVTSGPEAANFLPVNRYDQFACQTFTMPTGGVAIGSLTSSTSHSATSVTGLIKTFVLENDMALATMIREFGSSFSSYLYLSNGGMFKTSNYPTGSDSSYHYQKLDKPNLIAKESTSGLYVVASADSVPDWAKWENGYTVIDATLSGFVRYTRFSLTTDPVWWDEAVRRAAGSKIGYPINENWPSGGDTSTSGNYQYNAFFEFAIPCKLISTSFPSLTTVYRQWDYDYVATPAGLAAALVSAQDWIPWEGRIQTVADSVTGAQDLDKKWHVANALPACASMAALPKSIVYDIERGRKTINLGSPARTDFGTLAARFRRSPKDNITYL